MLSLGAKVSTGKRSFSDFTGKPMGQPSKSRKPMNSSEAIQFPQGSWMRGVVVGLVENLTGAPYIPTPPEGSESHKPNSLQSRIGQGFNEAKGQQMASFGACHTQNGISNSSQLDSAHANANSKQTLQSVLSETYKFVYRSRMMEEKRAKADLLAPQQRDHQQYPSHRIY